MKRKEEMKTDEALKCIWMTAGIVGYKLCEQEFDCENCAFDRAIRGLTPEHRAVGATADQSLDGASDMIQEQGYRMDGSAFYHPAHLWLRVEEGGRVRVGLDDFGQKLTGRIYSVHLPESDSTILRDGGSWSITHGFGETLLSGGACGRIVEVNRKLELSPSLINVDPYGKGWAFVLEPDDLLQSLKSLQYGGSARRWVGEEIHKLRQLSEESIAEAGITLPDGGVLVSEFSGVASARIINLFLAARGSDPAGTDNATKLERR